MLVHFNVLVRRWLSDEPIPGLVEVELEDATGTPWTFVDKVSIFDASGQLGPDVRYPVAIEIAGTVQDQHEDLVLVSTAEPWGIQTVDGVWQFWLRRAAVTPTPQ